MILIFNDISFPSYKSMFTCQNRCDTLYIYIYIYMFNQNKPGYLAKSKGHCVPYYLPIGDVGGEEKDSCFSQGH